MTTSLTVYQILDGDRVLDVVFAENPRLALTDFIAKLEVRRVCTEEQLKQLPSHQTSRLALHLLQHPFDTGKE